jgi:hypothetical protein
MALCIAIMAATHPAVIALADDSHASSHPTEGTVQDDPVADDVARGVELLARVEDDTPHFDDAAFYWLLRRCRRGAATRDLTLRDRDVVTAWIDLTQRPSEFRGRVVIIEGVVAGSRAYVLNGADYADIGAVMQTEIVDPATMAHYTVVHVGNGMSVEERRGRHADGAASAWAHGDSPASHSGSKDQSSPDSSTRERAPAPIPLDSIVRVKGYFLKTFRFVARSGDDAYAPLIVARDVTVTGDPIAMRNDLVARREAGRAQSWLIAAIAAMAVVWIMLRMRLRRTTPAERAGDAARHGGDAMPFPPPTDEEFEWLDHPPRDDAANTDAARGD